MIPLSYAQRRLWFLNRLEGPSATYNVPLLLELAGVPDRAALAAAVADVVARHETLRTVFPSVDGEPVQQVLAAPDIEFTVLECRPAEVDSLVAEFVAGTFDVASQVPLRVRLFVAGPHLSVLALLLHHIATDGASTGPLLRDLTTAYSARLASGAPEWEPLPVQYADYTLWQRELLGEESDPGSVVAQQLAWWREALTDAPAVLDLPLDRPRPAEPSRRGGTVIGRLDADTHRRLAQFSRAQRASMFMAMQAGLAAALTRVGAGPDVPIGAPVAGRPDEALHDLIGFFVNTVVLRTDVSGDPSFVELVGRVRDADLAAYAHEEVPFDLVVERLNPARSLSHHPFFQVMLTVDAAPPAGLRLGDLPATVRPATLETAKFDLTVFCAETHAEDGAPAGVEVWFQYAVDLFDEATVRLLLEVYLRLLRAAVADPTAEMGSLDVLTDAERLGLAERRAQLAAATTSAIEAATPPADGPLSAREEILCGLFATALGVERIGRHDNFFRSGGHSLLATKLVNQVRTVLGVEIGLRDFFLAPTVAGLDRHIGELASASARPPLIPVPRPDLVPLSYAQRRLWFLNEMGGASRIYNIPVVLRLHAPLDPDALAAAAGDIVARHEVLRTLYAAVDGEPFQLILDRAKPEVTVLDITAEELPQVIDATTGQVFDLGAQIPLRVWLVRVDDGSQLLVVLVHHIAGDGWSTGPLLRDLAEAYAARRAGRTPDWEPLPVQYADYTLWQRKTFGMADDPSSLFGQQLAYWRSALDGIPQVLELPTDRPRPAVSSHRGDVVPFTVDARTHSEVLRLARETGSTVFMVLQAAFAALLSRLGAGTDIPIGTVVAGRTDAALDDVVGFFVNTLVLRTDVSGNPTFTELLARVRDTDLAAYDHQDLPFERLVEELNPTRSTGHHPLVQVTLVLQNTNAPHPADSPLAGTEVPFDTGTAKFDLTLAVREEHDGTTPGGIRGVLEYATDLFDQESAVLLAERFGRLLRAALAAPHTPVGDIDLLTSEERQRFQPPASHPRPPARTAGIADLVAARAAADPNAIALVAGKHQMSYAELDTDASRLASHLAALGVRRGDVVGVLLESGVDFSVAALGALRAGAAYLPLDPNQPDAALAAHAATVTLAALLTSTRQARRLPGVSVDRVVHIDACAWRDRPVAPPPVHCDPNDAAVVLVTAGTGASQAVLYPHRSLLDAAGRDLLDTGGQQVWFAWTSPSTGDFTMPLWTALASGATCVLPVPAPPTPARLAELVAEHGVTTLVLPAALFALLADEHPAAFTRLRQVVTGGQPPSAVHLARARRQHPHLRLVHAYGSAEGGPWALGYPVAAPPTGPHVPVAGDGHRCHVLDERLRPVPPGVRGELYLCGPGLTDGYPNQPGATAAAFVPDPCDSSGGRMLRTGDWASWAADGTLRVHGPVCGVTLRGVPIDPYRVVAALTAHPAVRRAAVVVRADISGDERLVAYVVSATPGAPFDTAAVRQHAAQALPEYLVPAEVVVLPTLPLTPDGRLDSAALPVPAEAADAGRDPRESLLRDIFSEVLDGQPVDVNDNFFRIGGHSLLAVRLVNRIRSELHVEVTIRDVFQAPSVAKLVERLAAGDTEPALNRPTLRRRARAGAGSR